LARKLRISSRDLRYVALFAVISTMITSSAAYVIVSPQPSEQFFLMRVLGSNGLEENYYPNNNSTLTIGESVNWTIGVYNHMSSLEYVVIRVKLLNSTILGPDELTATPSPAPTLLEFRRILVDNETYSLPFVWKLNDVTASGNYLRIIALTINGTPFAGSLATAESGLNYRFVFELWFYDTNTNQLSFSWTTQSTIHIVWNQLWFNATNSR
jgi:hypothetical protein